MLSEKQVEDLARAVLEAILPSEDYDDLSFEDKLVITVPYKRASESHLEPFSFAGEVREYLQNLADDGQIEQAIYDWNDSSKEEVTS